MPQSVQIQTLPLSEVHLNPANPRGYINQTTVDFLVANMATEGQKTSIKVAPLGMGQYQVFGGDHRVLAARKLGWETIRAEVLDIASDQTFLDAYLDNQGQPMNWWATYMAIEILWNQTDRSKGTQKPIAARLMKSEQVVSRACRVLPLLTPASREAILQNLNNGGDYEVAENPVYRLSDLGDPQKVEEALKVVLDKHLTEPQTKALVASMKAGAPAEAHVPTPKPAKGPVNKPLAQPRPAPQLEVSEQVPSPQAPPPQPASAPAPGTLETSTDSHNGGSQHKAGTAESARSNHRPQLESAVEIAAWDILAGLPVATQIRAKIKKGERPTLGEAFILLADLLWRGFLWVGKHGLKISLWFVKELWKTSKKSAKWMFKSIDRRIGPLLQYAFGWAFFLFFAWTAYAYYFQHDALKPIRTIGGWISHRYAETIAQPVATPMAVTPVVSAATPVPTIQTVSKPHHKKVVAVATPAPMRSVAQVVPTATKGPDVLGQAAGDIAKAGVAGGVKSLFGL